VSISALHVECSGVRAALSRERAAAIVTEVLRRERVMRGLVSVTFLATDAMARLNRRHLAHRGATDVITFALTPDPVHGLRADIYVCPAVARAHARHAKVSVREETARLLVHAVLHACGWSHPEDAARLRSPMWARQERLLQSAAVRAHFAPVGA
jgi:probable rRNA maturation factor